jgi:tripartite ATP-independent transporter DctM subunit
MAWWGILLFFIFGLLLFLMAGFPVAFSFFLMDLLGILIFMGPPGLQNVTLHVYSSIATFSLAPVPMFILMGELMFHSKIANNTIDILDQWLGRVPGRLSLLAALSGTIFAATSGSTMANTAMLGSVLLPEMKKRGYSVSMSVGPIVGVGGLAMLIPPSALAVVLASIGRFSVGKILVAGVIPGVILGALFAGYIVLNAWLNPSIAPSFQAQSDSLSRRLYLTVKYLLPMAFIIFMVLGVIVVGIATPTEAAASGFIANMMVAIGYRRFNWKVLKATLTGSLQITGMVFMIIAASKTFSSILAFTGASGGLTNLVQGLNVHPMIIVVCMQLVIAFMGTFMESVSIMMICLPIFMPICHVLGFDPVWFGILMLINLEMGQITPPFGMLLFVMKGVAPREVTIQEICKAAVPYIVFDILVMGMIMTWPQIAMWLPSLVK